MNAWAQGQGQPGLGYIFFKDGQGSGPIAKNIGEERTAAIRTQLGLDDGDACSSSAASREVLQVRRRSPHQALARSEPRRYAIASNCAGSSTSRSTSGTRKKSAIDFAHNPFSMPQGGIEALNSQDPLTIKAYPV
jgi:aspartyl-tRNA synthetase